MLFDMHRQEHCKLYVERLKQDSDTSSLCMHERAGYLTVMRRTKSIKSTEDTTSSLEAIFLHNFRCATILGALGHAARHCILQLKVRLRGDGPSVLTTDEICGVATPPKPCDRI